jgi:hypothetical protein
VQELDKSASAALLVWDAARGAGSGGVFLCIGHAIVEVQSVCKPGGETTSAASRSSAQVEAQAYGAVIMLARTRAQLRDTSANIEVHWSRETRTPTRYNRRSPARTQSSYAMWDLGRQGNMLERIFFGTLGPSMRDTSAPFSVESSRFF